MTAVNNNLPRKSNPVSINVDQTGGNSYALLN